MKILHTSDWHLGQSFMGKSREESLKERIPLQIKVVQSGGLMSVVEIN